MAVKLRLRRMGKKRQPIYKVVAADIRSPRDGRFIEAIGLYNPKTNPATMEIKEERALYWLGVGAQPTNTVKNILSKKGIILKKNLIQKGLSEEEIANQMDEWNKKQEAKLAKLNENKKEVKKEEAKIESEEIENKNSEEVKGAASEDSTEEKAD
ncbi:MAG: 30S ribosomal protein S16 [Ignavibacteria bacterium]